MNITEIITSLSEETIITGSLFIGAGVIYILRKFSFLNNRIDEFEQADAIGRELLERDLMLMNQLMDELRHEYKSVNDSIEEELVEHELVGLKMAPKFQDLGRQITDVLDNQSDSIIDAKRGIVEIATKVSHLSKSTESNQYEQINSMIPKLISKLNEVNESVSEEGKKVAMYLHELTMIKRAIGVE